MEKTVGKNAEKAERFLQLFVRHQLALRAFVGTLVPTKSDGDDVMQEISLALWKKWDEYDSSKKFLPWACGMARVEVLRYRRKVARSRLWFNEELIELLSSQYERNEAAHHEKLEVLPRCIERLSDRDRQYITLRYREGGSIRTLIEATGQPRSSVYRLLSAIRERLRLCIEKFVTTDASPDSA